MPISKKCVLFRFEGRFHQRQRSSNPFLKQPANTMSSPTKPYPGQPKPVTSSRLKVSTMLVSSTSPGQFETWTQEASLAGGSAKASGPCPNHPSRSGVGGSMSHWSTSFSLGHAPPHFHPTPVPWVGPCSGHCCQQQRFHPLCFLQEPQANDKFMAGAGNILDIHQQKQFLPHGFLELNVAFAACFGFINKAKAGAGLPCHGRFHHFNKSFWQAFSSHC